MNTRVKARHGVFGNLKSIRTKTKGSAAGQQSGQPEMSPPIGNEPVTLDAMIFGEEGLTSAHLIPGPKAALVDPGPANTADNVITALDARGIRRLDSIVLTHIHFDHAGAAGRLARHYPEAKVYIHSRTAMHLADPSRLIESARGVWGKATENLFGLPQPIGADRIRPLGDGDSIDLGDRRLRAVETPGHTRAHMAFLDEDTGAAFCGDALGLQIPGSQVIRPSTPPSDYSKEQAIRSIDRIREIEPTSLHLAHFGMARPGPEPVLDRAAEAIQRWHASFERKLEDAENEEDLLRRLNACVEATLEPVSPVTRRGFEAINPTWLNIAGMTGERDRRNRRVATV